jgi:hypothetical protein
LNFYKKSKEIVVVYFKVIRNFSRGIQENNEKTCQDILRRWQDSKSMPLKNTLKKREKVHLETTVQPSCPTQNPVTTKTRY